MFPFGRRRKAKDLAFEIPGSAEVPPLGWLDSKAQPQPPLSTEELGRLAAGFTYEVPPRDETLPAAQMQGGIEIHEPAMPPNVNFRDEPQANALFLNLVFGSGNQPHPISTETSSDTNGSEEEEYGRQHDGQPESYIPGHPDF